MDEEAQRAVADPLAIMKRDETENSGRDQVSCERDASASTLRQPGRRQPHGPLTHSSTRPSDLQGMQPVSDPATNRRCVFVTLCDRWLTVYACVV